MSFAGEAQTGGSAGGHFEPGDVVAERYRVIRFIARGGMGEVYEVEDVVLGARVALKALRAHLVTDDDAAERFRREILLARQVTHPNVCRIFDLAYHGGGGARLPVLTMELLGGRTLAEHLHEDGPLAAEDALRIALQLAAGLSEAHRRGIVHRDLKSANIVLEEGSRPRVVITDFGLARSLGTGESFAGSIVGTPTYMAPEQIAGGQVGPHTDVYALGIVLHEMLSGVGGKNASQIREELAAGNTGFPVEWVHTIESCLAFDPRERPASMDDVVAALNTAGSADAAAASRELSAGEVIGRFRVLAPVAGGGAGVYRARDPAAGRSVTLRVLPGLVGVTPRRLRRLEEELGVELGLHQGAPFLIGELETGTRLRSVLDAGGPPRGAALRLAADLASVLADAHDAGVVLGELRAESVIVDDDLTPRLAELAAVRVSAALGKKRGDPRGDLVALGLILAELVRKERRLAPVVTRLIERGWHSARDLAFHLSSLAGRRHRAWWAAGAAAAVVLGAVGLAAGRISAPVAAVETIAPPVVYHRLTYQRGRAGAARFGEGGTVVYAAAPEGQPMRVMTTLPGAAESRPLTGDGLHLAALSRRGELALVRYDSGKAVLARGSIAGGAPRDITEHVPLADFLPGGELVVLRWAPRVPRVIELPPGKPIYTTPAIVSALRASPLDGAIAFAEHPIQGDNAGRVALLSRSGEVTYVTPMYTGLLGLAWSPDGEEIWFSAAEEGSQFALFATTRAGRVRKLLALPLVTNLLDVGPRGALVSLDDVTVSAFARAPGADEPANLSVLDYSMVTAISRDGRSVLLNEGMTGTGNDYETYLRPIDGSPAVHLGRGFSTQMSPDGKWVLAFARDGARHRVVLLPTGAGDVRTLPAGPITVYLHVHAGFFPDGRKVLLAGKADGDWRLWEQDVDGGEPRPLSDEGWRLPVGAPITPDGTRAIVVDKDGKRWLRTLATGENAPLPGLEDGRITALGFTDDGAGLLVWSRSGRTVEVSRLELATGARLPVSEVEIEGDLWNGPFVSPDGLTLAFSARQLEQKLFLISGLGE